MKNIAVFVSGGGTNLQAIIDGINSGRITNGRISLVLSSKDDVYALERAENHTIPVEIVRRKEYPDEKEFSLKILEKMRIHKIFRQNRHKSTQYNQVNIIELHFFENLKRKFFFVGIFFAPDNFYGDIIFLRPRQSIDVVFA